MWEKIRLFFLNTFRPVYLHIIAADIEQGCVERCVRCPATVAAQRQLGTANAFAARSHITVYSPELGRRIAIYDGGSALTAFTTSFDNFEPVQPITIKLTRRPVPVYNF